MQKRLEYIDICKAFGIILVILGHTYYGPQVIYNIIYCFHMPLFFIVSGFTFRNSRTGFFTFAGRRAKKLLIPYGVFGIINLLCQTLWKTVYLNESIELSYIFNNFIGIAFCYSDMQHMPNCSPIWFLLCLYITNLLFYWIEKLNIKFGFLISVLCMGFCYLFSKLPHTYTSYIWKFPVFFMAIFLMHIGYIFKKVIAKYNLSKNGISNLICLCILFLSITLEIITENDVGMNENLYGNIFVFLGTAVPISIAFIMLCRNFSILHRCRFLLWLGRNTIYVIGFNYLCRDLAVELFYLIPYIRNYKITFVPLFVITFALCIVFVLSCSFIVKIVRKQKREN